MGIKGQEGGARQVGLPALPLGLLPLSTTS